MPYQEGQNIHDYYESNTYYDLVKDNNQQPSSNT